MEGAVIVARDGSGQEVARATTDADGVFVLRLAPGSYRIEPLAVEGLMGTPAAQDVVIEPGRDRVRLEFSYDTGIR